MSSTARYVVVPSCCEAVHIAGSMRKLYEASLMVHLREPSCAGSLLF